MSERGGVGVKPPCPKCGGRYSVVIDGRESTRYEDAYRRRRKCLNCSWRFNTIEIVEYSDGDKTQDSR